jgi:hypothetical protein
MKVERKATTRPPASKATVPPTVVRAKSEASYVDVMDRVLDKGIVIDAHMRIAIGGIDLFTIEARMVVASFETYLRHSESVRRTPGWVDGYQLKSVDELRKAIGPSGETAKSTEPKTRRRHRTES